MFGKLLNKGKKEDKDQGKQAGKEKEKAAKAASPAKSAGSSKASPAKKPSSDSAKSAGSGAKKAAGAPAGGASRGNGTRARASTNTNPSINSSINISANGSGTFEMGGLNDSLSIVTPPRAAASGGGAAASALASPAGKEKGLRTPRTSAAVSPAKPTGSPAPEADSPSPSPGPAPNPSQSSTESAPEPPEEFVCPLSLEMMYDPVIVSSGQTYERAFIQRWLEDGHTTCPKTRQPLDPNSIFPNQVVRMMIADWCKENGVPLPVEPKVVSVSVGPDAMPARAGGQDAASRARALALESQRRQRQMMEQLAAQRRRVPSRRRHQKQDSIPEGVEGSDGAPSGVPSSTGATAGEGDSRFANISTNQVRTVEHQRARTGGEGGDASSTRATDDSGSFAPSMNSIAHSFVSDSASWPGPLAMQSAIFQSMMGTPSQSGSFSVGGEGWGEPGNATPAGSISSSGATQGSPSRSVSASTDAGDDAKPASKVSAPQTRAAPGGGAQSLQNLPAGGGAGFSGNFPQRLVHSGAFEAGGNLPGTFSADLTTESARESAPSVPELKMPEVADLVANLSSEAQEEQAAAVALLRVLTRFGSRQAKRVVRAGAISSLVALTSAPDEPTVEHAVTTLLNISLNQELKPMVIKDDKVIPSMVAVVNTGMPQARSNAAATLYLLSTLEGVREELLQAGAVPALVKLLEEGNDQGKKDAANCLLSICLHKDNRKDVAESGVIKVMCGLLAEGDNIVEEQTAGVCASIVRDPEGRNIMFEEGAITALAELVEAGETARTKEYAVNALLGLAVHSKACLAAIDDEGITASIDVMTRTGSTKTQAKATALLELLRRHGEGEE